MQMFSCVSLGQGSPTFLPPRVTLAKSMWPRAILHTTKLNIFSSPLRGSVTIKLNKHIQYCFQQPLDRFMGQITDFAQLLSRFWHFLGPKAWSSGLHNGYFHREHHVPLTDGSCSHWGKCVCNESYKSNPQDGRCMESVQYAMRTERGRSSDLCWIRTAGCLVSKAKGLKLSFLFNPQKTSPQSIMTLCKKNTQRDKRFGLSPLTPFPVWNFPWLFRHTLSCTSSVNHCCWLA